MYEDLIASTAATANVFAMAALAARENRVVKTVDIGGAYLMNASMVESGVIVYMRLVKVITIILVKIDPALIRRVRRRRWIVRSTARQNALWLRRSSASLVSHAC